MHATALIAEALDPAEPDYPADVAARLSIAGRCCLTGAHGPTLPRADVLGKSFVDGALLACPDSDRLGVAAAIALRYKWERMSSWIAVGGSTFRRLDRQGVRAAVLGDPPDLPWAGYATTSYKKHGSLRAPVNGPGRAVWLFESRLVDCCDRAKLADWWQRMSAARRAGLPRPVIEHLDPAPKTLRAYGLPAWLDFEAWARPRQRAALYAFLCYLLPSEDELRKETA
jgi:hypothetical protein